MKIRSDFITNSSSYSSVVVRIQSKKLAELLAQYQELFNSDVQVLPDGILVEEYEAADGWDDVPQSLEQLLDALLDGLEWNIYQKLRQEPLARQLKQEIKENKRELTDSVQKAVWDFQNNSYGEFVYEGMTGRMRFAYDKGQGGKGDYREEPYREDGYEDDGEFDEFDENEEE